MDNDTFVTISGVVIALLALWAVFSTYKWFKWSTHYKSKTIRFLRNSAIATTIASLPLAVISIYRVTSGPDAPSFPFGLQLLILGIVVLIGNLSVTTYAFKELDIYDEAEVPDEDKGE